MKLQITVEKDHIHAVMSGDFRLDKATALTQEVLETCAAHKIYSALFDFRPTTGVPDVLDRYRYIEALDSIQKRLQHAGCPLVLTAYLGYEPFIDPGRIGEVMARCRGLPFKATTNEVEAKFWLGVTLSNA